VIAVGSWQSFFWFKYFNPVQSKCFSAAFLSDESLVVSGECSFCWGGGGGGSILFGEKGKLIARAVSCSHVCVSGR
jgi:hypothetical protein